MKRSRPTAGMVCVVLGLMVSLGARPEVWAQADSPGHFADREEVVGYWEMVPLPENLRAANTVDPWPLPFQYFALYDDGRMFTQMSSQKEYVTPSDLDAISKMLPANMHYKFEKGFMVVTMDDVANYVEIWGVNCITKPIDGPGFSLLPGDLLMSLDDGKGNVIYRRQLRRLKAE